MSSNRKRKQRRKAVPPKLRDRVVHDQGMWIEAVEDLRHQLGEHSRYSKPDKLRFQDGRLIEILWARVKAAVGKDPKKRIVGMFRCYRVITACPLGYDEPLRLHCEEMKAKGLQEKPRTFCRAWVRRFALDPIETGEELWFRVKSIASWMEVQESFSQWLAFKEDRAYWRAGEERARSRAFQARWLADLPSHVIKSEDRRGRVFIGAPVWEGLGLGYDRQSGRPWSRKAWANILYQAAGLAKKGSDNCTPLEQWVWWCYPIFSRYGWNAREVSESASARGFDEAIFDKGVADFRRYWLTRGLRFSGRKTKRSSPPLAEFVRGIAVPALDNVRGVVVWATPRSLTKKN
jgi:hypothetical protein